MELGRGEAGGAVELGRGEPGGAPKDGVRGEAGESATVMERGEGSGRAAMLLEKDEAGDGWGWGRRLAAKSDTSLDGVVKARPRRQRSVDQRRGVDMRNDATQLSGQETNSAEKMLLIEVAF